MSAVERPRLGNVPSRARRACARRGGAGIKDADTFFGIELPALTEWAFGPEQAAAIHCPVLSVRGTDTQPLWVEVADFLRSALPHVEDCTIDGVGHLLHIQRPKPVARGMAEFLGEQLHGRRLTPGPTLRTQHGSRRRPRSVPYRAQQLRERGGARPSQIRRSAWRHRAPNDATSRRDAELAGRAHM